MDLQMDSDSGNQHNNLFERKAIDTTHTSISLTDESCLVQMFGTSVKLVSLGSAVYGKLWCSKHTLYPKGMPVGSFLGLYFIRLSISWNLLVQFLVYF